MTKRRNSINLEKALGELEKIVNELESGDLSLEESLKRFERGVLLTRDCQKILTEAEQKVDILIGGEKTAPFPEQPKEDGRDADDGTE